MQSQNPVSRRRRSMLILPGTSVPLHKDKFFVLWSGVRYPDSNSNNKNCSNNDTNFNTQDQERSIPKTKKDQGSRIKEQGARSRVQGARSKEQGGRSKEQGAKEQGNRGSVYNAQVQLFGWRVIYLSSLQFVVKLFEVQLGHQNLCEITDKERNDKK